jgi:hypothetical protein
MNWQNIPTQANVTMARPISMAFYNRYEVKKRQSKDTIAIGKSL